MMIIEYDDNDNDDDKYAHTQKYDDNMHLTHCMMMTHWEAELELVAGAASLLQLKSFS